MALRDFVNERRTVRAAGHTIVCSSPTVEAVFRFVLLFDTEIRAVVRTLQKTEAKDSIKVATEAFADDPRSAEVLACCCVLWPEHQHPPDELLRVLADQRETRIAVAHTVVDLCDVMRIAGSFGSLDDEKAGAGGGEDASPSSQEVALVYLAQRFGCSDPSTVTRWPYEMWMAVMDVYGDSKQPGIGWLDDNSIPGVTHEVVNG